LTADSPAAERGDARLARRAAGVLSEFNRAGVLSAADVHVAELLARLSGEADEDVLLGAALAVRAPRLAHVCVDVATVRSTATSDRDEPVDVQVLPWPDVDDWVTRLSASALVAGDGTAADRPLRLDGRRLYLDRYWREECRIAADLGDRSARPPHDVDAEVLAAGLDRLFGDEAADLQRLAAEAAVRCRLAVVAGGPGTGKTTTVARILALLEEQAVMAGRASPRVALAAPTGKAASRLEEAVRGEAMTMPVDDDVRARLLELSASTVHRLLGWNPASRSRFRHDRDNRLPHDVVIVDETSMVSLSLMAKLVDAVRRDARLVLVGDPDQLASVEAGAVLGDIVGPAEHGESGARSPIGDGIVVLRRVHRFGGGIARLAAAIQAGDADAVVDELGAAGDDVHWIDADVARDDGHAALDPVRDAVVSAGQQVSAAAANGDGPAALEALGAIRVLCAHRRGPYGVAVWTGEIERWLAAVIDGYAAGGPWYVGRPLLVTENDYALRLFNGDTGVVVDAGDGAVRAVFERSDGLFAVSPRRLSAVDTVHAMTVHKSQGSQFEAAVVVLPDASSAILTRELLYTAVTRARHQLTVVGTEDSVRAAVARPIARASGLGDRLWG
jgi:exodeoxyribonuclease V alpha subunit